MKVVVSVNRVQGEWMPLPWVLWQAVSAAWEGYRLLQRWPRSPWMTVVRKSK